MFIVSVLDNPHTLVGFVSDNGKMYFTTIDVARFLHVENVYGFAEHIGTCQIRNITDRFGNANQNEWCIEYQALINRLETMIIVNSERQRSNEETLRLLMFIKFGKVRVVETVDSVTFLKEDATSPENFVTWMLNQRAASMNSVSPFRAAIFFPSLTKPA